MLLKIFYSLTVSLLLIGIYHWIREWFQDYLGYSYFSFPKVKKTDKLFEFVEKSSLSSPSSEVTEEKEVVKKEEEEELFQFIDGL